MKTRIFLFLVIILGGIPNCFAQTEIIINTPKNTPLTAYNNMPYMSDVDKDSASARLVRFYPNATEVGYRSATNNYNCHGYAWHVSEGGSQKWIGLLYYDPDPYVVEDVYWTDLSYIETTEQYASKISYYTGNHSAIQTATQGIYISKWSNGCLVQHARDDGPAGYQMYNRKYYRLNPGISGSTEALCSNQERTFTSNTTITGSSYSWTKDDTRLDYVSGSGTISYRIKAKNTSGNAWVQLQITTPSGEVATTPYKYFWIGIFANNVVTGQAAVCPNSIYTYTAQVPGGHYPSYSYSWTYPSNWMYSYQYQNTIRLQTPMYPYYGTVRVSITNACGTSAYSGITVYPGSGCGGYYSLYPNPASDNVTILINEDPSLAVTSDSEITNADKINAQANEPAIYTIRIFSSQGTLLSTVTRAGKSFTIPLNNLRDGIYVIEVNDGKNSYRQQLIVKHD